MNRNGATLKFGSSLCRKAEPSSSITYLKNIQKNVRFKWCIIGKKQYDSCDTSILFIPLKIPNQKILVVKHGSKDSNCMKILKHKPNHIDEM